MMKRKVRMFMCVLIAMCASMTMAPAGLADFQNSTAIAVEDSEIVQPRTDIKEWRYKVIGDHLYKRLFNASTGRWETDWILVA